MRAARVEALTPFPLASSANCLFHPSKPAAVLPHCAASALLAINGSAIRTATVIVPSCPPLVIPNSFHTLCIRRNAGSSLPGRGVIAGTPRFKTRALRVAEGFESFSPAGSRLGHLRKHALHQLGIAVDAARLQQILHFGGELVDGRILGGEPGQRDSESERGLKIRGTLPPCIGKHEVEYGHRPRRLDQCLHLVEESRRQPGDRVAVSRESLE